MSYEIEGIVKVVQESQTFGSGFTKRELVITDNSNDKYPQDINVEFVQDKVSLLDDLSAGDLVSITFDIRGREYNGRYFNNLQGWKLSKQTAPAAGNEKSERPPMDEDDQIPF